MDATILNDIPFQPTLEEAVAALHVGEFSDQIEQVKKMLEEARGIARPKAMYQLAVIEERKENRVVIGGIPFESRVLRVNTDPVNRVFVFIATCGQELAAWQEGFSDMINAYYADQINQLALNAAREHLLEHLKQTYQLGKTSTMNPGSLEDWPISEQRPLFKLLGDTRQAIGVELLPSMLMSPSQTVSGFRFSTEEDFHSCQMCPIENCPHRKAPFQENLFKEKYG